MPPPAARKTQQGILRQEHGAVVLDDLDHVGIHAGDGEHPGISRSRLSGLVGQIHLSEGFAWHPDGTVLEPEDAGQLDDGGREDDVAVERFPDLLREQPHLRTGLLLQLKQLDSPVQILSLIAQEILPPLHSQELGDEREESDSGGEGN